MAFTLLPTHRLGSSQTKLSFAERIAGALADIPVKIIARVAGVTPKAAERWKAGDNAPNAEALCRLCAEFDRVWEVTRQQSCRSVEDAERILSEFTATLTKRRNGQP